MPKDVEPSSESRAAGGMTPHGDLPTLPERDTARPTPQELGARIAARGVVELREPSELSVRRLRDAGE